MDVAIELMSQDILDKVGQVSGAPELLKDIISAQGFDSAWEAVGWLASLRSIQPEDILLRMQLSDASKIFESHWQDIIILLMKEAKKSGDNEMLRKFLNFIASVDDIKKYQLVRNVIKVFSTLVDEIA
jgi:hypothetical protein